MQTTAQREQAKLDAAAGRASALKMGAK
jgi:hypothetical protein